MRSILANRFAVGLLLLAGCCITSTAIAQFGGGGGFGGGRGGGRGATTNPYGTGGVGNADITYDQETRKLVIVSDEKTFAQIEEIIRSIDRPSPQVLIKVAFVEVSHSKTLDIGIEGGVGGMVNNSKANPIFGSASNIFGLAQAGASPIPPGAGIYQILGTDFQATLRAIATAGKSELLSRPSILARNNQTATISLGQQVPLISGTRFDTLGNQINTVTYQNVGISLEVTPYITPGGMVEMAVTPQASVLADRSQWVPTSSGPGGVVLSPVINQRAADTVVIVPDGQTVVIGGLMQSQGNLTDNKIPILGDIPFLGNLFKHRSKDNEKRELLIFLTPYIVQHPAMLAGMTEGEKAKTRLMPQSFSEQELERYLQTLPVKGEGKK